MENQNNEQSVGTLLTGVSPSIQAAREFAKRISVTRSSVLISGETGTGKEVLARQIHCLGMHPNDPFVVVNCAGLSGDLIESELFGHERGSFSGAIETRPGKFELANKGTIFLDEIGEMSLSSQAKLLRVLQEGEFIRVGGTRPIQSHARVIASTSRDLTQMVKEGTFREDLYYRINVFMFTMPPLSQRTEDIPYLVDFYLAQLSERHQKPVALTEEARKLILKYSFPGNIRELQNILECLVILERTPSCLLVEKERLRWNEANHLSFTELIDVAVEEGLSKVVEGIEAKLISKIMEECKNNQVHAAHKLKISRGALQYKLKKLPF